MKQSVLFVLAGIFAAALPPLAVSPAVAAETVVVDDGSVTIPPTLDAPVEFTSERGDFSAQIEEGAGASDSEVSATLDDDGNALISAQGSLTVELSLPVGTHGEVYESDAGGDVLVLTTAEDELLGAFAVEPTFDEAGASIDTEITFDGERLTASAAQASADRAVALRAGTVWYSRVWVTYQSGGKYVVNAIPTELGRRQSATNVHYLHVRHLKSLLGAKANLVTYTIEQQFLCHEALNLFEQGTYNMESWRKGMPWWQQANPVHRCNP